MPLQIDPVNGRNRAIEVMKVAKSTSTHHDMIWSWPWAKLHNQSDTEIRGLENISRPKKPRRTEWPL